MTFWYVSRICTVSASQQLFHLLQSTHHLNTRFVLALRDPYVRDHGHKHGKVLYGV